MYTLKTQIELPIAHRLPGAYSGLCVGNISRDGTETFPKDDFGCIHGHNYFITFAVSSDKLNEDGMLLDFKKVKKIIHEEMDKFDHSLILKDGDALIKFYKEEYQKRGIDPVKTRLYVWDQAPTAEYMAYHWWTIFKTLFEKNGIELTHLAITVEETSKNSVTYERNIND